MNTFRVGIFLCCVPAIFANGCNPIDPCAEVTCDPNEVCVNGACVECDGAEDCFANQSCINGSCLLISCFANDDCDPNEFCIMGGCVECVNDADCDDQNACTADSCAGQACSNSPISCASTADCPAGCKGCDEVINTCVECVRSDDCNDNNACTLDYCSDQDCFFSPFPCSSGCPAGCACGPFGFCTN